MDNSKISNRALIFSIVCFLQGSSMILSFTTADVSREAWVVLVASFAVATVFYLLYGKILQLYPQKNLIQICKVVFGKYVGSFLSLIFTVLVFFLTAWNICHLCNFFSSFVLLDTPISALIASFTAACVYGTAKGIKKIIMYAPLLFGFIIITTVTVTLLQVGRMDPENLLPVFSFPAVTYAKSGFSLLCTPILEVSVFMMIADKAENRKTLPRVFIIALFVSAALILLSIVSDTAVLGNAISYISIPKYEAVKYITAFDIFARTEIIFAVYLLMTRFFKAEILLAVLSDSMTELFHVKQKKLILPILGATLAAFALLDSKNGTNFYYIGSKIAPFVMSFFEIALPLAIISATLIRRKGENK